MFEYGLTHVLLFGSWVYFFGILYGTIILAVSVTILVNILPFFGIELANGRDISFFYETERSIHNWIGVMITEKMDFTDLKQTFYKKGILRFKKLRSTPFYKFGFWFWREVEPESVLNCCIKKVDSDMNSQEDINMFVTKLMHSKISHEKPQWDIYVKENYLDSQTVIFTRLHHTIGDGMSFFSLFSFMNDSPQLNTLPKINEHSRLSQLLIFLVFPLYAWYAFYKFAMHKKDPNWTSLHLKNKRQSGLKQILNTKSYDFDQLRAAYKQFDGVKFNDFVMGILGVAFK